MTAFALTKAARSDLRNIGRFTRERCGAAQRDRYLTDPYRRFFQLADRPELAQPIDHIVPGYRRAKQGRYLIFFRQIQGGIQIVRVLHEAMDVPTRFRSS